MNKDKINKLIAIKVIELVEQVNFGEWDKHNWRKDENGEIDYVELGGYCGGPICKRCGNAYCEACTTRDNLSNYGKCIKEIPNYIDSEILAWDVFNKVNKNNDYSYRLSYDKTTKIYYFEIYHDSPELCLGSSYGDSISEVICLACLNLYNISVEEK